MSVKKNTFSKLSEIFQFHHAPQETDPSGAVKDEEPESPSKPSDRSKLYRLIALVNVVAVLVIVIPLAIILTKKQKSSQKSLAACGYDPEDVSRTRLSITIDGLDSPFDDSTTRLVEEAIRKAYDETSGRCADIYDRWMSESWIYGQQVVTSETFSSSLVIDFIVAVSCDGCPPEEHFASSFGDVGKEVRKIRRLGSEEVVNTFDAVDVIQAMERRLMDVLDEAEGISKFDVSSKGKEGMTFTVNLLPCDGEGQRTTSNVNSGTQIIITVDMCQQISRVFESDNSENETLFDSDTSETETPLDSGMISNNETQPDNTTAAESDSVSTNATACPCFGTEVESIIGKCGVWSSGTRFSKDICSNEEGVCGKYIVDLTGAFCIAKPNQGEELEVTELSAGQMETCRSILQSQEGCAEQ